jgi:hypothetical protein
VSKRLLIVALLVVALLRLRVFLRDKVADVAPLIEEGLHLDRLLELCNVLLIRGCCRR